MQDNIHIACAPDDNYVPPCGAMLNSLFTNNPTRSFFVHIIQNGLSEQNQALIAKYLHNRNQAYQFYSINEKDLSAAPVSRYITIASYYRIFLPSVLDKNIDKILYLDCDLLVRTDIMPLWNTDVSNCFVGAVKNIMPDEHLRYLGMKVESGYFNAGMLLINLKKWREDNITEKSLAFITANADKLDQHDQDVLNVLFQRNWKKLEYYWNVYSHFYMDKYVAKDFGLTENEYQKIKLSPGIVHFVGAHKPWMYSTNHPLKHEFFKYLQGTLWASYRGTGRPGLLQRIKTGAKKVAIAIFGKSMADYLAAVLQKSKAG